MRFNPKTLAIAHLLWILGIPAVVNADIWDMASRFQVSISAQEEYTDNIDLTAKSKRSEFITTISPGIKFSTLPRTRVPGGSFRQIPGEEEIKLAVVGEYRPGFVFYAKDRSENYVSHNGTLNAWYGLNRRLTFRVRDYLIRSDEPREADFRQTAVPGEFLLGTQRTRDVYFRNVFEPALDYQFQKGSVFSFSYRNNYYDSPTGEDSRENFFNPSLLYRFDIRNSISLKYGLTFGQFERSPDLVGHMASTGYTYRLTPYTSLLGEYTFLTRDFATERIRSVPPVFPPLNLRAPARDYVVHNFLIGIGHNFTPTFSISGRIGYFWQIPEVGSTESAPSVDVLLSKREGRTTFTLSLKGGYEEDYFTAENLGFTKSYRAVGTVSHSLGRNISASVAGGYYWTEPSGTNRKENTWDINGNVSYRMLNWLALSFGLTHRENSGDIASQEYAENRALFAITATY